MLWSTPSRASRRTFERATHDPETDSRLRWKHRLKIQISRHADRHLWSDDDTWIMGQPRVVARYRLHRGARLITATSLGRLLDAEWDAALLCREG